MKVEVVYCTEQQQICREIEVAADCTVKFAIEASRVLAAYPSLDINALSVGIFSSPRQLSDKVKADDRVEIYRPLLIDPKQARVLRAKKTNLGCLS